MRRQLGDGVTNCPPLLGRGPNVRTGYPLVESKGSSVVPTGTRLSAFVGTVEVEFGSVDTLSIGAKSFSALIFGKEMFSGNVVEKITFPPRWLKLNKPIWA